MDDVPFVLVTEDDELIQGILVDALTEAGFEGDCRSVRGRSSRAARRLPQQVPGAGDGHKTFGRGKMDGWEVARQCQRNRSSISSRLCERRAAPKLGLQRRSQQHHVGQAVRASAACHRCFPATQCLYATTIKARQFTVFGPAVERPARIGCHGRPQSLEDAGEAARLHLRSKSKPTVTAESAFALLRLATRSEIKTIACSSTLLALQLKSRTRTIKRGYATLHDRPLACAGLQQPPLPLSWIGGHGTVP